MLKIQYFVQNTTHVSPDYAVPPVFCYFLTFTPTF